MPGTLTSLSEEPVLDIAIVGGGIIGLILANGLCRQDNVRIKVYEQAQSFREIGAGMAFTANAAECMEQIDPAVLSSFQDCGAVAIQGSDSKNLNAGLQWVDGYNQHEGYDGGQKWLYAVDAGYKGFQGCRRDQFLESLVSVSPPDMVECKKRLETFEQKGPNDKIELTFSDGTSAKADAVIGCDGLKSHVREAMLGKDNPASYVRYTHKIAYRGLIPMDKAVEALGDYQARNQHFYVGPDAHIITYPVANQTVMNVSLFVSDPGEWKGDQSMVAKGTRKTMEDAFDKWSPRVRALTRLLPEELQQWALFDLWDYPAPYYNQGKVCLAGDAAHASSPHHGAGACMGVEDALCLSTLIKEVTASIRQDVTTKGQALKVAFETFNTIRRPRTQWLVNSSRRVCDLYQQPEWGNPARWVKAETCFEEIKDRSYKIWHFDYNTMIMDTIKTYRQNNSTVAGSVDAALNGLSNGTSHGEVKEAPNGASKVKWKGTVKGATNGNLKTGDMPVANDIPKKVDDVAVGGVSSGPTDDVLKGMVNT